MVIWEESLDLLDDRLVAGFPLSLAHFAPVSDKLLYGGLQLVHVKRRGRMPLLWILLEDSMKMLLFFFTQILPDKKLKHSLHVHA